MVRRVRHNDYSGIVYIESELALVPRQHAIEGHWENRETVVQGPGWETGVQAVAWGRKRAPIVLLRIHRVALEYRYQRVGDLLVRLHAPVDHDYIHYDAGEVPWASVPGHQPDPQLRRWPGARDSPDADVVADYGGTVYLVQERPEEEGAVLGYTARWEALHDGVMIPREVVGPRWEGDFRAAVAWARERAPYVLIHHPRGLGYQSAGESDLPGLNIPRWEGDHKVGAPVVDAHPSAGQYVLTLGPSNLAAFPIPEEFIPAGGFPD